MNKKLALYISLLTIILFYGGLEYVALDFYMYGDGEAPPRELTAVVRYVYFMGILPGLLCISLVPFYYLSKRYDGRGWLYTLVTGVLLVEGWTILSFNMV